MSDTTNSGIGGAWADGQAETVAAPAPAQQAPWQNQQQNAMPWAAGQPAPAPHDAAPQHAPVQHGAPGYPGQQPMGYAPAQHGAYPAAMIPMGNHAMPGKVRNTWACIGLTIVTLGIYSIIWVYSVYSEMKRYRGAGTSGGLAVVLYLFIPFGLATFFMTPSSVSDLYTEQRRPAPVSGATGLWCFLPFLGGLVWFIQVNNALNDFWTSVGAGTQRQAIAA